MKWFFNLCENPQFSVACGISSRAAEFGFLPRNWAAEFNREIRLFAAECCEIWRFSFEQLFFHRKWPQSSSVTSFFMMIFCLMVMV